MLEIALCFVAVGSKSGCTYNQVLSADLSLIMIVLFLLQDQCKIHVIEVNPCEAELLLLLRSVSLLVGHRRTCSYGYCDQIPNFLSHTFFGCMTAGKWKRRLDGTGMNNVYVLGQVSWSTRRTT